MASELSCELTSCAAPAAEPTEGNYFVAAYPPFSCWRPELAGAARDPCNLRTDRADCTRPPLGLYVHIPFCAHRCEYCYYLSYAVETRPQMDEYVEAVLRELTLYRHAPAFAGRSVDFVYFGGGTPSLLPADTLARLLREMQTLFPWDAAEEVTFECAPRSATPGKIRLLRDAGVNRLSLGVQQLDDRVLGLNGRVHLVADVERAWEVIRQADFDEINVDLIVGLVGETDESFRQSLEQVLDLGPDSVTVYQLEIPLNTPLYRALRSGQVPAELPGWPVKHDRLAEAFARLEAAGYRLRSAYAATRGTRHGRFVYQEEQYRGADLLGIGTSSLSYVTGTHWQNAPSLTTYLADLAAGRLPVSRAYRLSAAEQLVREFVLQLKLGRVEADRFRAKFGVEIADRFAAPLSECAGQGWLTYDRDAVTLTRAGLLRADRLLPAFYLPEHRGLRYS